jgi:predicted permease
MDTLFSIIFIYIFILLGFLAKSIFKERIDSKTLTIMSVYFMQPFVTLWGFSISKLELKHLEVTAIYLAIIFILLIPTIFLAKAIFSDKKERSIFTIAGFVGNTGNIGIPLGIILFGQESAIYTTLINLANVFVIYGLGVYIYSRGSFSIKNSLFNIIKIPIIPAALVAITVNILDINMPSQINKLLQMGAYSGIVLQLFLLGTFLESIKIRQINKKLYSGVIFQKFILIPVATFFILDFLAIDSYVKNIILMQMITPLAVANINLASLYDCKPKDVTNLIFISTMLFIFVLYIFKGVI